MHCQHLRRSRVMGGAGSLCRQCLSALRKCSQVDSLALPTMGRTESDDVAKVFVMARGYPERHGAFM